MDLTVLEGVRRRGARKVTEPTHPLTDWSYDGGDDRRQRSSRHGYRNVTEGHAWNDLLYLSHVYSMSQNFLVVEVITVPHIVQLESGGLPADYHQTTTGKLYEFSYNFLVAVWWLCKGDCGWT